LCSCGAQNQPKKKESRLKKKKMIFEYQLDYFKFFFEPKRFVEETESKIEIEISIHRKKKANRIRKFREWCFSGDSERTHNVGWRG
jgi:hypothetical protein